MKIRIGKATDRKEYLRTQKEAFPSIDSRRDSRLFDEKIRKKEIFVAEENGAYAGHICFGAHANNPPFPGSVFIEEFAVKEEFRGKGLGTSLLQRLVEHCKQNKVTAILLGTGDTANSRAVKYYENQGFKKIGWLKDINPNPEYDHPQLFYG